MSDYISRQDAIEAVAKAKATDPFGRYDKQNIGIDWALDALNALPSEELALQTPQTYGKGINPSNAEVVEDYISRADAIEAVENNSYGMGSRASVKAIKALPSAEPKTGEWEYDPNGMDWNIPAWRCSECGFVANYIGVEANGLGNSPMIWAGSKYCPECGCKIVGARMNKGGESDD